MLARGTSYVLENEPCFLLTELDKVPPKGKTRRYRTLVVVRNDNLAEYVEDMGPSAKLTYNQCRILGGVKDPTSGRIFIEHTVSELREIADRLRTERRFDAADLIGANIRIP